MRWAGANPAPTPIDEEWRSAGAAAIARDPRQRRKEEPRDPRRKPEEEAAEAMKRNWIMGAFEAGLDKEDSPLPPK